MEIIKARLFELGLDTYWGILVDISQKDLILGLGALIVVLSYFGAYVSVWSLFCLAGLWGLQAPNLVWMVVVPVLFVFNVPIIRQYLISLPLMVLMKALKFLPKISETERTAIEAGTVWVDSEIFSGNPDLKRLNKEAYPGLTDEEQAFLDGPVSYVCRLVNDWNVHQRRDFSKEVWDYLKKEKFFGMIIPKQYGGLGFSASANSAVITKLSSRSTPLGITVMVPNSLGPAELLIHYGTEKQKDYYLPRLAIGKELPCFALTEPQAGSDAGAITANGVVFEKEGEPWVRLNWKKRYITLAAVSTVLGMAFKMRDPDEILGKGKDVGITCALIPAKTSGVVLGNRHDPMGIPFYNCPTEGHDVEIPLAAIIGGLDGVGQGWKMLMESLSAGRGISLPANATGGTQLVARVAGAYSFIRKQFGMSIGKFEGIEEPLARIAGNTYMLEAARRYTNGGLDGGAKPAVVSAMIKYLFTDLFRESINDGMDILGGAGISMGPRNLFAHPYKATPVGITVEGANILTRTLIVFGQGAIRCHPYVLEEVEALEAGSSKRFDRAFWKHVKHVVRNLFRMIVLGLTRGYLVVPPVFNSNFRYYQKLSWVSAHFAFFADVALATLGGNLKRKEKLTGRFADIMTWMYMIISVLRRFEAEGRKKEDKIFVDWCCQHAFAKIQEAFEGLFANMGMMYAPVRFLTRLNAFGSHPSDILGGKLAHALQVPGEQRDRLTPGIFIPHHPEEALGRYERAFTTIYEATPISKRLMRAIKVGKLSKDRPEKLIKNAVTSGVINEAEAELLMTAEKYRRDAIQVDDFSQEDYVRRALSVPPTVKRNPS
jgi:acyl-CoA dehydrogenase